MYQPPIYLTRKVYQQMYEKQSHVTQQITIQLKVWLIKVILQYEFFNLSSIIFEVLHSNSIFPIISKELVVWCDFRLQGTFFLTSTTGATRGAYPFSSSVARGKVSGSWTSRKECCLNTQYKCFIPYCSSFFEQKMSNVQELHACEVYNTPSNTRSVRKHY